MNHPFGVDAAHYSVAAEAVHESQTLKAPTMINL
jgi:hypothetical protein